MSTSTLCRCCDNICCHHRHCAAVVSCGRPQSPDLRVLGSVKLINKYYIYIKCHLKSLVSIYTYYVKLNFHSKRRFPTLCCCSHVPIVDVVGIRCKSVHCPVPVTAPNTSSRPIIFCVDADPTFEGNFVLATLADDVTPETNGSQQQQQQQQSQQQQSQICDVSMATTSGVEKTR